MLNLSVKYFSGFELLCNKAAMTKELNNPIGYLRLGEKVYPVIAVEVSYDTDFYVGVNLPPKALIPVAIIGETPFGVQDSPWFMMNDVYAREGEAYYDYAIPNLVKWISKSKEKAAEPEALSFDEFSNWYEICDITEDDDSEDAYTIKFASKEILKAVGTSEILPTMFPILYYRQERLAGMKWDDEDGDMHPVMRLSDEGITRYYAVMYEHSEGFFSNFAAHIQEVPKEEVYYIKH